VTKRGWLVDNNVPRGVTHLLRERGHVAIEVRDRLGGEAPDSAIAALARSEGLRIVTHDVEFARRCRANDVPALWLRTAFTEDRQRLDDVFGEVVEAITSGARQLVLTRDGQLEADT
jgi:predicted nuclease of predicted toxin-antitoxin system